MDTYKMFLGACGVNLIIFGAFIYTAKKLDEERKYTKDCEEVIFAQENFINEMHPGFYEELMKNVRKEKFKLVK